MAPMERKKRGDRLVSAGSSDADLFAGADGLFPAGMSLEAADDRARRKRKKKKKERERRERREEEDRERRNLENGGGEGDGEGDGEGRGFMSGSAPVKGALHLRDFSPVSGSSIGFFDENRTQPASRKLEDALSTSGDAGRREREEEAPAFEGLVNEGRLAEKQRRREGKEGRDAEKEMRAKKKQIKRAKKMERSAILLQTWFRSKFARAVLKRMRRKKLFALAAHSGVLLACEGTAQGRTGWYQQSEDSIPVYYEVNERGEWKLVC